LFDLWLSRVHLTQGDTSQVNLHLRQYEEKTAARFGNDRTWSLSGYVSYYAAVGEIQQALALCDTILTEDPTDHHIENVKAYLLIEHDIDVDRGVAMLEDILERHPELTSPETRIGIPWGQWYMNDYQGNLGWGYYKQGRYGLAVQRLEAACAQWFTFDATLANRLERARTALAREQ
jgi:hypothetical protein